MIFSLILLATLNLLSADSSDSYSLTIEVKRIKHEHGTLHICLMTAEEEFLSECAFEKSIKITSEPVDVIFRDIPQDTYGVSLFHDLDDDNELALDGLFGLPSEPYGFSNNPSMIFGPPSFKKCSFVLDRDKELTIKLK